MTSPTRTRSSKRLGPLRRFRKSVTTGALDFGMRVARRSRGPGPVESIRDTLTMLTRYAWPLRVRLARNMKAAGLLRPGLVDEHFERAIDHLILLANIFRTGPIDSRQRFVFEDSIRHLRQAHAGGRGVITIAPHLVGFPIYGPAVAPLLPCTLYVRNNHDPRKMGLTEAIAVSAQCRLAFPAENASKMQKLQVAIDVLRRGEQLYITPDTPRRPSEAVAVSILGRTTWFPTGVFVMSMRTGAPVVPAWWHFAGGKYHVSYGEPYELGRGDAKRKTESAMVDWASKIDAFLREHPAMWWNWLDKRWTRIVRGRA